MLDEIKTVHSWHPFKPHSTLCMTNSITATVRNEYVNCQDCILILDQLERESSSVANV